MKNYNGIIDRYFEHLPIKDRANIITLKEGNTPLIRAHNIERQLGITLEIYLKYEGMNPTGSFKDRGMTVAVSAARENGSSAVICASTGNTSAAAAAYAARAGMRCVVLIPNNAVATGKLAQAVAYGARVIAVEGNFDAALKIVRELSKRHPITLVNSINPNRIEGQKTAAFEICDELLEAPDYLAIPVGNAGNISAYWKGFKEYHSNKIISGLPRMLGFQAAGAAPIVEGRIIENPQTIATAIRIGNPASWHTAVAAVSESGGVIHKVTDEEILEAYSLLSKKEGIFAEPASAASLAGVLKLWRQGYFKHGGRVVCVLTGHGLKDPDTAIKSGSPPAVIPAEVGALEREIYG
ncbi:threonine synthase [Thermosediminibacter litoriperuensis]|uniref:Threonine synthase n=1 Tax=Thermosediminibacter litoriperuensis TaxID=291989 RepID=A0A5S5AS95_9FIRM|nr:threonine synthase [Thermosediminibacter litoriperuensis]TYP54911.1 L-threonine synthase [Thermosediminibacter litoriperuensis]